MARTSKYTYELGTWDWWTRKIWTRTDSPGVFSNSSVSRNDFSGTYSRFTTKDPNWKVLVMQRRDASGGYVSRRVKIKPVVSSAGATYYTGFPAYRVDTSVKHLFALNVLSVAQEADNAALADLALARLKRKMSGRTNQMNVIVPVVELREFRKLIVALTFSAVDLVNALIRIKKSKGKAAAQFAAHAWLTWSFAMKPTVSDIANLRDLINTELFNSGNETFTDYGAAKKEWFSRYSASATGGYGVNGTVSAQLQHELSYRYVAGYTTPLRAANDYSAKTSFGLEMGALLPALWELTLFSWLYDYFTTMGDYLEDTFITDTNKCIYVNRTKKYSVSGELLHELSKGQNLASSFCSNPGSSFEYSMVDRTVLSSLPSRILRFKSSDEIGKNAINKLLNLGSVLVGGKALSNRF